MTCLECDNRNQCKKPCQDMKKELRAVSGSYYEEYLKEDVVIYPQKHHVQYDMDENKDKFSCDDKVQWLSSSGHFELRLTNIFIDRFFGKKSFKEIAEKYQINEHTAETNFANAINQIEQVVKAMDSRKAGVKHSLRSKRGYTDAQKFFLLVKIFGFSGSEVARIFNIPITTVNRRIREMSAQYDFSEKAG